MRLNERGATQDEIIQTVEKGEKFPAKFGRTGYRRNFTFNGVWSGKNYAIKQVEAYVVEEGNSLIVITVIVKYF